MNLGNAIENLIGEDVTKRSEALDEIEEEWKKGKLPILYDILCNVYPSEVKPKIRTRIIKLITKMNPIKAIHNLQVFYENEKDIDVKTGIIRNLSTILHSGIEEILYKILSNESNKLLVQVIRRHITLHRKTMIEEKRDTSKFTYYKKVKFSREIADEVCMICKLKLHNNDDIFQCYLCKSYYHWEHLDFWLKNHGECPVCNRKLY